MFVLCHRLFDMLFEVLNILACTYGYMLMLIFLFSSVWTNPSYPGCVFGDDGCTRLYMSSHACILLLPCICSELICHCYVLLRVTYSDVHQRTALYTTDCTHVYMPRTFIYHLVLSVLNGPLVEWTTGSMDNAWNTDVVANRMIFSASTEPMVSMFLKS
jgi:hypothetical protein